MILGLLTIAAIPTTIAVAQGVSEQKKENLASNDEQLLRKFKLNCWCEGKGKARDQVHNGNLVVGEGKVWIQSPLQKPLESMHPFCGFYITYPDDERPKPAPMGLVTTISDDPPMLNWIYVDKHSLELKYGNRTQSREHLVGSWKWTNGEEEDNNADPDEEPGGLTLGGEEKFVVVEPVQSEAEHGRWEVRWDKNDNGLRNIEGIMGRKVLRVSLERTFIGEKEKPEGSNDKK